MEAQVPKRRKGKKKVRKSEAELPEESELTYFQPKVESRFREETGEGSGAGGLEETSFPDVVVDESKSKQPLRRSDSELSSIVIVGQQSPETVEDGDSQNLEEITSARTKAVLVEPDHAPDNIDYGVDVSWAK